MNFYEVVSSRSSIRRFDSERKIPEDLLRRILEAGRLAPSAKNLQPWKFIVVSSPDMLKQIHACYAREWLQTAPHLLIVTGDRNAAWVRTRDGYNSIETDLAIAMDHLILAATSEGIGTCWIAAFDEPMLRSALGLRPEEVVFAFTPLGYAAQGATPLPKTRKPLEEVVKFL